MPTLRVAIEASQARAGSKAFTDAMEAIKTSTKSVAASAAQSQAAVGGLGREYMRSTRSTRDYAAAASRAAETTRAMRDSSGRLRDELGRYSAGMDKAKAATAGLGAAVAGTGMGFGRMIAALGAMRAAYGVGREVLTFEERMAELRAATKGTATEMQKFSDVARQVGTSSRFGASEAAAAMVELAKAGFDQKQIMDSLPSTLDLAITGQLELGRAANVTVETLSQFKMPATEATRVIDVLARTANVTTTSVSQLVDALAYAGSASESLGIPFEQVAAALGVLGDNGIHASMGGTALRGVMQSLLKPTEEATQQLKAMGLSLEEVNPDRHDFITIFERFNKAQMNATDAVTIFRRENSAAALIFSENARKLRSNTEDVHKVTGVSKEMAAVMGNTTVGAFKRLTNSVDDLGIALGESGLLSILNKSIDGWTRILNLMGRAGDEIARVKDEFLLGPVSPESSRTQALANWATGAGEAKRRADASSGSKQIEHMRDYIRQLRSAELQLKNWPNAVFSPEVFAPTGIDQFVQAKLKLEESLQHFEPRITPFNPTTGALQALEDAAKAAQASQVSTIKGIDAATAITPEIERATAALKALEEQQKAVDAAAAQTAGVRAATASLTQQERAAARSSSALREYVTDLYRQVSLIGKNEEAQRALTMTWEMADIAQREYASGAQLGAGRLADFAVQAAKAKLAIDEIARKQREVNLSGVLGGIDQKTQGISDQIALMTAPPAARAEMAAAQEARRIAEEYGFDEAETQRIAEAIAKGKEEEKVLEGLARAQEEVNKATAEFAKISASAASDLLDQLLFQAKTVKEALASVGISFARSLLQQGVFKLFGFERGAAFAGGSPVPFAAGDVVDRTTFFPMRGGRTGMMGEAGPEAILPLRRDRNGRLGVQSAGGGGGVTINMRIGSGVRADEFRRGASSIAKRLEGALRRRMR